MRKNVPVDVVVPAIEIVRPVRGDTCIDKNRGTTQDKDDDDDDAYELLLGLVSLPAIHPMRTTGKRAPQIRTRQKERMSPIFKIVRMIFRRFPSAFRSDLPFWTVSVRITANIYKLTERPHKESDISLE